MAKLSAHGYEVCRISLDYTRPASDFDREHYGLTECRYTEHLSFRSDGHILQRIVGHDVHPRDTEPRYRRHDWGWKLWKVLNDADGKRQKDPDRIKRFAQNVLKNAEASDRYTVSGSTLDELSIRPA